MKTFKELCNGKMHVAVRAMIEGLYVQSARPDFRINMDLWGESIVDKSKKSLSYICFGCAATCTVQQITGVNLFPANILAPCDHARQLKTFQDDTHNFENAIDAFRLGWPQSLYAYFGVTFIESDRKFFNYLCLPLMNTNDWEDCIGAYLAALDYLTENDI